MRWYRAFKMSDDGTTVTMKSGIGFGAGTSASPSTLTASQRGNAVYYTSAATSGETYARYHKITATAGSTGEFIAGRDRTVLSAAVGNAHGAHDSLEVSSTGYVTGLGTAVRGNIVMTNTAVPQGTYYAVMGELYPGGNTSALPTASNACLCCSVPAGTAIDAVANAIAFVGTDSATSMIYSATDATPDWTGSIRILVNGAKRYLHFTSAAAS